MSKNTEEQEKLYKEYKEFLEKHEHCNFQQSIEWGNLKEAWNKELVVTRDENGKINAGILLLVRHVRFFGTIIYASRGPVVNTNDFEVFKNLMEKVKEVAKTKKAIAVLLEPEFLNDDMEFRDSILKCGFVVNDNGKDFSEQINPRFVFRLDIKNKSMDELIANFHSKTRYNVKLAQKKGVEIYEGTREDLKRFHEIMVETGQRDNFGIRPLSYFESMHDNLGKEHFKLLMAKHEEDVLSGIILITYGNKVWYLYGASSNTKRNLMPNYLLQLKGIEYANSIGAEIYDFRGVPGVLDNEKDHPQYGLYRFKKGFNAEFIEFIGQVYLPINPLRYNIFMVAQKVVRRVSAIIKRIKNSKK